MSEPKYKNEREMWHAIGTFSNLLTRLAKFNLQELYNECIHYYFDSAASESQCLACQGAMEKRGAKEFDPDEECWQCEFYQTDCPHYQPKEVVEEDDTR